MDALDLRTVRLRPGEQHDVTVAVELEPFELGGQTYRAEPARPEAAVTVTRMTSGYVFRLELALDVVGPCVRCLGEAREAVTVDATEVQEANADAEELETPYLIHGRLDVSQWARDAVALALPERMLCRDDCAGICPVCGADLNLNPHAHESSSVDPRWAELARLRDSL